MGDHAGDAAHLLAVVHHLVAYRPPLDEVEQRQRAARLAHHLDAMDLLLTEVAALLEVEHRVAQPVLMGQRRRSDVAREGDPARSHPKCLHLGGPLGIRHEQGGRRQQIEACPPSVAGHDPSCPVGEVMACRRHREGRLCQALGSPLTLHGDQRVGPVVDDLHVVEHHVALVALYERLSRHPLQHEEQAIVGDRVQLHQADQAPAIVGHGRRLRAADRQIPHVVGEHAVGEAARIRARELDHRPLPEEGDPGHGATSPRRRRRRR